MLATTDAPSAPALVRTANEDRGRRQFAAITLALALTPIVVTVGRALVSGWVPISDAAYFTVRSRDVFTPNHPWLGAWSSASATVGSTIRNLGPLQLDLLAPFTKVDPYAGTAIGVGVVAAASVFVVWWSARRVLGDVGAGAAMVATLALEAAIGSQGFIDPRQQVYLLLPYWALLWLTWAAASGHGAAIAPIVIVASLIVQSHFTYLFQTVVLVLVGLGSYGVMVRERWREVDATRRLLVGAAIGLVCWVQPLWDQVWGDHNLSTVLSSRGADPGVGLSAGVRVIASTVLVPPRFWLPGSMDELAVPPDLVATRTAWIALLIWLTLLAGSVILALRRGNRKLALLGGTATAALVAAVVASSQIPRSAFGLIPQNYFWMWPTGVFLTVGLVAGLSTGATFVSRWFVTTAGFITLALASVVPAIIAGRALDHFAPAASAVTVGQRVARPLVNELAVWLPLHGVTGPVVVDYSRASFATYLRYVFLVELQKADIEFRFQPLDTNLVRFGDQRCSDGDELMRIVLADAGGSPEPREGELVLAHVDAFSDANQAELAALDRQFGDWLREGSVVLDLGTLEYFAGRDVPGFRRVMSSPGQPATGLARQLSRWTPWGVIDIPSERRRAFDRWVDLELRSSLEDVTVLLAPPLDDGAAGEADVDRCPT